MHYKTKRSPLHNAVVEEQAEIVSYLISQGAKINARDVNEMTSLHLAVGLKNVNIVKMLLKAGADVHAAIGDDEDKNTPLNMAIKSNDADIIKSFLGSIGDVNAKDDDGFTPLHLAAMWGNSKTVQLLLDAGADVKAKDECDRTPLFKTCESTNNINILKLLIKAGSDVNVKDESNYTPLHYTVESDDLSISKLLIDSGANVSAIAEEGNTPIHEVAAWGFPKVFKLLIDSGGDVNALDETLNTPLHRAVKSRNFDILEAIVSAGANINAANSSGSTPLHLAVNSGLSRELVISKFLVEAGADLNIKDNRRNTPLHIAAKNSKVSILELLVYAGAHVNEYNIDGETCLALFIKSLKSRQYSDDKNLLVKGVKVFIECTDVNLVEKNEKNILSDFLESDTYAPVRKIFYKPILRHVAIMKTLNLPIDEGLLKTISEKTDYKNYFKRCTQELEKAKLTSVKNCWVKFFNLLVDSKPKLIKYAGNADLIKDLVKNTDEFPIYGNNMQSNVSKGIIGRESFEGAANMLSNHVPIFDSFHLIIRDILNSLSEKNWEKLCRRKRMCE